MVQRSVHRPGTLAADRHGLCEHRLWITGIMALGASLAHRADSCICRRMSGRVCAITGRLADCTQNLLADTGRNCYRNDIGDAALRVLFSALWPQLVFP
jgi:hypothetical protein